MEEDPWQPKLSYTLTRRMALMTTSDTLAFNLKKEDDVRVAEAYSSPRMTKATEKLNINQNSLLMYPRSMGLEVLGFQFTDRARRGL